MGSAKAGRTDRGTRFDPGHDSGAADSGKSFDAATRGRVQLVCDFVNAEVSRWRNQLIGVGVACLVGMVLFPMVTRIVDARVAVVIVAGIFGFWFVRARRELASSYGKLATKRLVAATNKSLTYKPVSSLTREQFVGMDLFPVPGKDWKGKHEVGGRAGSTTFSLHAVHAPSAERGPDVFRGVLVRLDFPTSFPAHTIVIPEGASGGTAAKRDLVLVNNPDFDRSFSAYSTDYMQARKLFTDNFMALVITAAKMFGPNIRLAFVRRSLYIAVPNATLLPDVTLLSAPLTPESATGQMARLATFAEGLAKAMGSN